MDSKQTVDRFNDALMYLVKNFDDRPFQKMGNKLTSRTLYSLNKKLGDKSGKYNSELLVPGLKLSETKSRRAIIYASSDSNGNYGVRICYYPSQISKFKQPMINVSACSPSEESEVIDLLRFLGLNPTIDGNEPFWDNKDVWAPL